MSSTDFRRIKSVHFFFLKSNTNIVRMRKKREILFNFWLVGKIQKHEIDFSNQRKKEKKAKIGETVSQKNSRAGNRVMKGSVKCGQIVLWGGGIKLREMKNLDLILEVSNPLDMTYESRDERGLLPAERRTQRGGGNNPIVAVIAEIVWRQPTSPSGGRHKDSTVGVAESNSEWN